jgi:hypothetical protein
VPRSVRITLGVFIALWLVGIAIADLDDHHGVDSNRVPLPILGVLHDGPLKFNGPAFRLKVECATDVIVVRSKDHGGSDLPEITVWGRPKVGRCHPDAVAAFSISDDRITPGHPGLTKFIDGATSQVVNLGP